MAGLAGRRHPARPIGLGQVVDPPVAGSVRCAARLRVPMWRVVTPQPLSVVEVRPFNQYQRNRFVQP